MQLWIHYFPGTGGDGFCNLIEHADEITPLDGVHGWRIHQYVDGKVKFWSPVIDQHRLLRVDDFLNLSDIQLTSTYKNLVLSNASLVISNHLGNASFLNSEQVPRILTQDRIAVWLYSEKSEAECVRIAKTKNLVEYDTADVGNTKNNVLQTRTKLADQFDYKICIEQVQQDKTYFFDFLKSVGLSVDEKFYHEYLDFAIHGKQITEPGIEYWSSYTENNVVKYRRLS